MTWPTAVVEMSPKNLLPACLMQRMSMYRLTWKKYKAQTANVPKGTNSTTHEQDEAPPSGNILTIIYTGMTTTFAH